MVSSRPKDAIAIFWSSEKRHSKLRPIIATSLANRVRQEVEWLRRGPKARTTKAKARVESAGNLIAELDAVKMRGPAGHGRHRFHVIGPTVRNNSSSYSS